MGEVSSVQVVNSPECQADAIGSHKMNGSSQGGLFCVMEGDLR